MPDAALMMRIQESMAGLKAPELAQTAQTALANCADAECRSMVLQQALTYAQTLIPHQVGEGTRLVLGVPTGFAVGLIRGIFGPIWGRVFTLIPAVAGGALGVFAKDASTKAAGYSVLSHSAAGEAAVEGYDLGMIFAAKMRSKVTPPKPQAAPAGAQPAQ